MTLDEIKSKLRKNRLGKIVLGEAVGIFPASLEVNVEAISMMFKVDIPTAQSIYDGVMNPPKTVEEDNCGPIVDFAVDFLKKYVKIMYDATSSSVKLYVKYPKKTYLYHSPHNNKDHELIRLLRHEWGKELINPFEDAIIAMLPSTAVEGKKAKSVDDILTHTISKLKSGRVEGVEHISPDSPPTVLESNPDVEAKKKALNIIEDTLFVEGPCPTIHAFIDRMDFPKEFMAFLWKVINPDDKGRQLVWLVTDGLAGQSFFWTAFDTLLGSARHRLPGSGLTKYDESRLEGIRFAQVPDTKSRNFLNYEVVNRMTGDDESSVEAKYQNPKMIKLFCKLAVASNYAPIVDATDNAAMSRLLLVSLPSFKNVKIDPQLKEKYMRELPHFMWECKQVERELCGPHGDLIPVPEKMKKVIIQKCVPVMIKSLLGTVGKYIVSDPDGELTELEIKEKYKVHAKDMGVSKQRITEILNSDTGSWEATLEKILRVHYEAKMDEDFGVRKFYGVRFKEEVQI